MGASEEAAVLSLWRANEGSDDGRVDRIMDSFAEGAVIQTWEAPVVGREAIRAKLEQENGFSDLSFEVVALASAGSTVFFERTESFIVAGIPMSLHGCAVVEVDSTGKVLSLRDYFDMKEIEAQMSAATSTGSRRPSP